MTDSSTARELPPFLAHPLLRGPHLQTVAGAYLPGRKYAHRARRHDVRLEDGDEIVLHDDRPDDWPEGGRVALLLHGLGGSHRSNYVMRVAGKLNNRGVRAFRMDMRGCGDASKARRPGHAGRSDDVLAAVDGIQRICPGSPISLVGFSLGGNIALKLAGELGDRTSPLDGVFAAGPPIDLAGCAVNMRRPERRIYSRSYVRNLMRILKRRRADMPGLAEMPFKPMPLTIDEFDDRFTAPLSGFRDVDDYYEQASAKTKLTDIRLPTLIIVADDDPIVPIETVRAAPLAPCVRIHATCGGGHLGFLAAPGLDLDRRWLEWRVVDWVLEHDNRAAGD